MPQTLMILLDNTLFMQNQDYLPSRFVLEKEAVSSIVGKVLQSSESSIGIAPLAQLEHNYMLTPTSTKAHLDTFISRLKLSDNIQLDKVFQRSKIALASRNESEKKMILFFGADVEGMEFDRTLLDLTRNIRDMLSAGIRVSVVLFGEKAELLRELISGELEGESFEVVSVGAEDVFFDSVMGVIGIDPSGLEDDPELAMALSLSLAESRKGSAEKGG